MFGNLKRVICIVYSFTGKISKQKVNTLHLIYNVVSMYFFKALTWNESDVVYTFLFSWNYGSYYKDLV